MFVILIRFLQSLHRKVFFFFDLFPPLTTLAPRSLDVDNFGDITTWLIKVLATKLGRLVFNFPDLILADDVPDLVLQRVPESPIEERRRLVANNGASLN